MHSSQCIAHGQLSAELSIRLLMLQVIKDPSDPTGPINIQSTGAPKALVIQRDISAAAGKIHVVQGPLVPASLVSIHWSVDVLTSGSHYHLCMDAIAAHAEGVTWDRTHAWGYRQLWSV